MIMTKPSKNASRGKGRPREFDEDLVIAAITDLFWAHGFEAVSITDIEKATGLHKGSLYAAFGSKQAMYLRALADYETRVVIQGCRTLRGAEDPQAALEGFMSAPIEAAYGSGDFRGCFLCNASADRAASCDETRGKVAKGYASLESALIHTVGRAMPYLSEDERTQKARLLLVTYSGLRVMARAKVPKATLLAARNAALNA